MSYDLLHDKATDAHKMLTRVAGIVEDINAGEWDEQLEPQQAHQLAEVLEAMTETLRGSRAAAGSAPFGTPANRWQGPLPFNRKERYFTGTVLPMVVADANFTHLPKLLELFGVSAQMTTGPMPKVQFLTEYGFAESIKTPEDHARWDGTYAGDTPDVVIAGPDWLLAIEAKMFHNPTAEALNQQMRRQAPLVDAWASKLGLPPEHVVHGLLLPERLHQRTHEGLTHPAVTWEQLLRAYRHLGPEHWVSVLEEALDRHEDLESTFSDTFGANKDAVMTGSEIIKDFQEGPGHVAYVGRAGGFHGPRFKEDVTSGVWATRKYEVRRDPISATNWFPVAEFVNAVSHE